MENSKLTIKRQCNNCRKFLDAPLVGRYQAFNRTKSIGDIICLCQECLDLTKDPKLRYIRMSD